MSIREGPIPDESPLQFGLRSLFLLMTAVAAVSALGHYFGEFVLRWFAFGIFLVVALAFVVLGPGLVVEVLTFIVDKSMVVIGVTKRALHKRRTVATNAAGQHDVAADRQRSVSR